MPRRADGVEAVDVVIVGAGPAGGVLATRLVAAGMRVVALEQGDWHEPASFPAAQPSYELDMRGRWSPDPNVRGSDADYPIAAADSDITPLMFNGVGGSSILYNADWCRLRPSDFRVRTLDGVADDWPICYADLEPYFDATDVEFGISGLAGDPSLPPTPALPHPPLPVGRGGRLVAHAHDRLGWHWWPGTNAVQPEAAGGRGGCLQWGTCIEGCPEGAKASADLTHWRRAVDAGVQLRTGARAQRVALDERGRASGVEYVDRAGREHLVSARVVVLAANGIGTPRLLLLSEQAGHAGGLANRSGQVGRRLMVHPFATVAGVFPEPLRSWVGHAGPKIVSYEFYESDPDRGFVRGAKWSLGGIAGPVGIALTRKDGGAPGWGGDHHASMRERLGATMSWGIFTEDLPEEHNRVTLDATATDSDGVPAARVAYRISENTRRMLDFHADRAAESLQAAGATHIHREVPVRASGWHLLGTARMGEDPETSVVDADLRAHDVPNLYVADGSTFVTSAGVNPTSTVVALAARLGEHLVRTRRAIAAAV
jgi:choline dehydrogenase-like flavoprotein